MYAPMCATHAIVKNPSSSKTKPKSSNISTNSKFIGSINIRREQPPAKRYSKSKVLRQFGDHYSKTKSTSSCESKENPASGEDLDGDEDQVSVNSNISLKRRVTGSQESFLTIAPEAKQLLTENETEVRSTSTAIDRSQLTASSEVSKGESSKIASSILSSTGTTVQNRVDSSGISRSDWAAGALLPREPTPANSERVSSDKSSITTSKASVQSGSCQKGQSFVVRSIDLLIEHNPNLEDDLRLIKTAVQEQEEDVEAIKSAVQVSMHNDVWEGILKIQKLEKRLTGKDELLSTAYDRIDELEGELKTVTTQLNSTKDHIKWLEQEIQKKNRDIEITRQDHAITFMRLDREKRALVESMQTMEMELRAETLKKNAHKEARDIAKRYNEALKKSYAFYREYFNKQEALYETYFGKDRVHVAVAQGMKMRPTSGEVKQIEFREGVMRTSCSEKGAESAAGAITTAKHKLTFPPEQATNVLRDKYVSANVGGQTLDPLRGAEFLAWLETSFKEPKPSGGEGKAERRDERNDERKEAFCTGRPSDDVFSDATSSNALSPISVDNSVSPDRPISISDFPSPPCSF